MRSLADVLVALALLSLHAKPAIAGPAPAAQPDEKQAEAIQRIQELLDERLIDAKPLQGNTPLAHLLAAVENQLPKEKRIALRIDKEAFGDKFAEVAATPLALRTGPKRTSLRNVLHLATAKIQVKADYRIGGAEVVITTPERALYAVGYDIRSLLGKIEPQHATGYASPDDSTFRNSAPAERAAFVVRTLVAVIDPGPIDIVNGTRLVIRANATRHRDVDQFLRALRRLGGVSVIVNARLYEVDDGFYTNLKKVKHIPWEEWERQFLSGIAPKDEFPWKLLQKQKVVQNGEAVEIYNGQEGAILSWHRAVSALPSPDQIQKGNKDRQAIVEGTLFLTGVQVSPDRRSVSLKLTEKAAELQEIRQVKVWSPRILQGLEPEQVIGEAPVLKESTHSQVLQIPDGGSMLVPVHFRPPSVRAKDRWWVLSITPRIYLAEEEQFILHEGLKSAVPHVVADVLNNPRLKTTREFYGTAGDKRFALVNSDAWTWPREFAPAVAGFHLTPAERQGKRLLGIRVDKYEWTEKENAYRLLMTLVNVGGSDNGAVLGGCTLRYTARSEEKGWRVGLAESEP